MSSDIARKAEGTRVSKLRSATRRVADVASEALPNSVGAPEMGSGPKVAARTSKAALPLNYDLRPIYKACLSRHRLGPDVGFQNRRFNHATQELRCTERAGD